MELKMIGSGTYNAADAVFAREFNEALVHQLIANWVPLKSVA